MPDDLPFTFREHATIAEVVAGYGLSATQQKRVWKAIAQRWHHTSGRFYAYTVAHELAAETERQA